MFKDANYSLTRILQDPIETCRILQKFLWVLTRSYWYIAIRSFKGSWLRLYEVNKILIKSMGLLNNPNL